MPSVELSALRTHICRDLCLRIEDGELLVLLGPTGAGKTTLLNVIAGLIPYEGRVLFDSCPVDELPTRKRQVGYVQQDYCLFPHLSVAGNIAFGLKARGLGKESVEARVTELLDLLRIGSLAGRYPNTGLSGGEQQRVALARALAPWPQVLLLDEPLNSLDPRTAKYLRMELRHLQQRLKITTVYVTHNREDAAELGDRVALLSQGRLEQIGSYQELVFSPKNGEVSGFFGSLNIFPCRGCVPMASGLAEVELGGVSLVVPYEGRPIEKVAISPWSIFLSFRPAPGPQVNRLQGRVVRVQQEGARVEVMVQCARVTFLAAMPKRLWEETGLRYGDTAYLVLPLRRIHTHTVDSFHHVPCPRTHKELSDVQ